MDERRQIALRSAAVTSSGTRWDLAEKVLAGEMTLEELRPDLQANTCFIIEDYVTQVGQGSVRERGPELLARTDAKLQCSISPLAG